MMGANITSFLRDTVPARLPDTLKPEQVLFRTNEHFMGGTNNLTIDRVIRVDVGVYAGRQPARDTDDPIARPNSCTAPQTILCT